MDIPPTEDLMREHGLLNRLLIIYEMIVNNIDNTTDKTVLSGYVYHVAKIIHEFIEEYHERLEEDYIFPEFEKRQLYTKLIKTLRQQHKIGRALTKNILLISKQPVIHYNQLLQLVNNINKFIYMYRAHESREDTIVFTHFRSLVTPKEFKELGETFERIEEEKFGKDGYFTVLDKVMELEKRLGIHDLSVFNVSV